MKVLVTAELFRDPHTGLQQYAANVIRGLAGRSDLSLTLLCESESHVQDLAPGVPTLIYRPPRWLGGGPAGRGVFSTLASPPDVSGFDIVHFLNVIPPFFRLPKGPRYMMTIHDMIPQIMPEVSPFFSPRFYWYVLPRLLPRIDAVIANSEATKRDIVHHLRLPSERVAVTLLGPPRSGIQGQGRSKEDFFLAVGTLEPRKNLLRVIQAFVRYRQTCSSSTETLRLVGRLGWRTKPLQRALDEAGDVVSIMGYLPDAELESLYQRAKGLVFPSLYEGFGFPLLEAMQFGCPVITSNVSSLPEVGGDAAIYVDPTDVEAIAGAIARLAQDAQFRERLAAKGLRRAAEFSWNRCVSETVEIYRRVLAGARPSIS